MSNRPNIVIMMTDQQQARFCRREGFELDTTPFLDGLARQGVWFNRAYTAAPICVAARISLLTGRWPSATRVRSNHNVPDATYEKDIVDVLKEQGYVTAVCGKNHSHLKPDRVDHWFAAGHTGGENPNRTEIEKAFDQYMRERGHRTHLVPTPFPVECQAPYRAVSSAMRWIETLPDRPFFLWLTFAEPHNPFQVPKPYFEMFPPESLPNPLAGPETLESRGFKWRFNRRQFLNAFSNFDGELPRARSNYLGMLRMIDDQFRRFVEFLEARGLRENTIFVFLSDHGDFCGEYGLMRKGPEMNEFLMRIPLLIAGPGIGARRDAHPAHVSLVDIMPTLCEAVGVPLPNGVQGRSLWPLVAGGEYPAEEFASVYAEQGFGGLHYTEDDTLDPVTEGALNPNVGYDCLNSWTQSGTMRMLRRGDWKLVVDMQGRGQLYNISKDPAELQDLYGKPQAAAIQHEMTAELLAWTLRAQDPLPLPRRRYVMKTDPRNYWSPYR
ncbi:MAG: sulfatase-like hydrolase/transferase [Candidatus Sumerlaeota bacterium]|nr:sulfatase-like hydrolase/transferase [Candidatus Sumerlaeota bacterium]